MKSIIVWGTLAISALIGTGCVEVVDEGGVCEEVSCGDALVNGLGVQGDALCDPVSNASYAEIFACGCGSSSRAGACEPECADNLCVDGGESGACGDCLNKLCAPAHNACIGN